MTPHGRTLRPSSVRACAPWGRRCLWPLESTDARSTHRRAEEIYGRCGIVSDDIERSFNPDYDPESLFYQPERKQLLIVDEAYRLEPSGLEQLRDYFDRHDIGLILIGMPGLERHLRRYPQVYSRIGLAHQYRPLDSKDILRCWPGTGTHLVSTSIPAENLMPARCCHRHR